MIPAIDKNHQALTTLKILLEEGKNINQAQINLALVKSQLSVMDELRRQHMQIAKIARLSQQGQQPFADAKTNNIWNQFMNGGK